MNAVSGLANPPAHQGSRSLVIGLTGPVAAGKSTVAELLRRHGATIIDADRVYRSLLTPGSDVWARIVDRFGPSVVLPDRQIDRASLAGIVFRDPTALADLERITHPSVVAEIRRQIADSGAEVVVVEAVKLSQAGLLGDVDSLWLVTAEPRIRLRRLRARGELSEDDARSRIAASLHVLDPNATPDFTIDTSGDMSCVSRQVDDAWRSATERAFSTPRPVSSRSATIEEDA